MLLLVNGAPGAGKSTLARRYADEHALALIVDIDAIRTQLGRWDTVDDSRLVARDLALALARAHLTKRRDVVVPQYLGRPEFRMQLELLSHELDARFVEVLLTDEPERIVARFRQRRTEYGATGAAHPEGDLGDDAVAAELATAHAALLRDAAARGVVVISGAQGPEAAYRALCRVLDPGP